MIKRLRRWYLRYAAVVSLLQHPLLLACRLYWGGQFIQTGFAKLTHLNVIAEHFAGWHVPFPYPSAIAAGTTELVCGSLLVVGLASRIASVPLIFTMIVAYRTALVNDVTDLASFVTADPFLFLMTCVLVLVFGPGVFSVDYLLRKFWFRSPDLPVGSLDAHQ
jgi:putative oxidoreductase